MLDDYYHLYLNYLKQHGLADACYQICAGQRFLYVKSPLPSTKLLFMLLEAGKLLLRGTRLTIECVYVRTDNTKEPICHVFRFRFLVPAQKQFCCGNRCVDCILRHPNKSG